MTDLLSIVVRILGASLLIALVLIGLLVWAERPIPDVLIVVVSTVLGLLGGLLAPRPDLVVSPRPRHAVDE